MSLDFDAVIVGAGFAGMYMLHRLRGMGFTARVFEAGKRRRRHLVLEPLSRRALRRREPAVLVPVLATSCSRNGSGRERYATQPEILRYANHVADRFDLRRDIQFDTRVTQAALRRERRRAGRSRPTTATRVDRAASCIMATGCLSSPNTPELPGPRRSSRARPTTPATGRTRASTSPASASA